MRQFPVHEIESRLTQVLLPLENIQPPAFTRFSSFRRFVIFENRSRPVAMLNSISGSGQQPGVCKVGLGFVRGRGSRARWPARRSSGVVTVWSAGVVVTWPLSVAAVAPSRRIPIATPFVIAHSISSVSSPRTILVPFPHAVSVGISVLVWWRRASSSVAVVIPSIPGVIIISSWAFITSYTRRLSNGRA